MNLSMNHRLCSVEIYLKFQKALKYQQIIRNQGIKLATHFQYLNFVCRFKLLNSSATNTHSPSSQGYHTPPRFDFLYRFSVPIGVVTYASISCVVSNGSLELQHIHIHRMGTSLLHASIPCLVSNGEQEL